MQAHIDKINEMATVMRKAIEVDEGRICEDEEKIKQLEVKYMNYFIKMKILFHMWSQQSQSLLVSESV